MLIKLKSLFPFAFFINLVVYEMVNALPHIVYFTCRQVSAITHRHGQYASNLWGHNCGRQPRAAAVYDGVE
jgi:hypothetical protein